MSKLSKQYLGLTFLILLIGWGTCLFCGLNGVLLDDHKWLYVPYALGGWSPTIASYFSLKRNNKVANLKEWLGNVFDFRQSLFSYLMVVILAIVFVLPQCLISGYEKGAPFFAIVVLIPAMLFGGGLEEAGWRYILQPELEKRYSFTVSTLMVSMIWWFWHLPLFFIQGVSQYGQNFLAFGISVLGLSFALASIRKNTGSVWLCVLFHSMINSLGGIYVFHENLWGTITATGILILCSYAFGNIKGKVRRLH